MFVSGAFCKPLTFKMYNTPPWFFCSSPTRLSCLLRLTELINNCFKYTMRDEPEAGSRKGD